MQQQSTSLLKRPPYYIGYRFKMQEPTEAKYVPYGGKWGQNDYGVAAPTVLDAWRQEKFHTNVVAAHDFSLFSDATGQCIVAVEATLTLARDLIGAVRCPRHAV
jgi:hypothetical protein